MGSNVKRAVNGDCRRLGRQVIVTNLSLWFSLACFTMFALATARHLGIEKRISAYVVMENVGFFIIVLLLFSGSIVYHLARLGALQRQRGHVRVSRASLEEIYDANPPALTILIPSYREEPRVVFQTTLSAALVEFPRRRAVVLIDDPPNSTSVELATLSETKSMITRLNDIFAARSKDLAREYQRFLTRLRSGFVDCSAEVMRLAELYEEAAVCIDAWRDEITRSTADAFMHTDRTFIEKVIIPPVTAHRSHAEELRRSNPTHDTIAREFRRLSTLFAVEIASFERKRFANLSHAPNKAMNLNSYIGLLGRSFREVGYVQGTVLEACSPEEASLTVPAADYLLTLDADSFVVSDYALRLIRVMEEDSHIAVAQTPYSAIPNAPGVLERVAGATTDIQYIIHQGFTQYNATYWVGANALLRYTALKDIRKVVAERGYTAEVFIQDRTVIEDTGSTVDLICRGWRLFNYPERLAYSATPADFGALIIQRRRWSNGGLIILGDLLRYFRQHRRCQRPEGWIGDFMRLFYLCSPFATNAGFLLILLFPWNAGLTDLWLPLSAAPYYVLYGLDLRLSGYRWADLVRVYALNLILLPVNLAGVLRSLQQAITGRKSAFGRTPKVENRTASAPIHILFQWGVLVFLGSGVISGLDRFHFTRACFCLFNAALYTYAITQFLGWRDGWSDIVRGFTPWPGVFRQAIGRLSPFA